MSSPKFLSIILLVITFNQIAAVHYSVNDRADRTSDHSKFRSMIGYSYAVQGFTDANEFVLKTFNLKHSDARWYEEVRLTVESFKEYGLGRYPVSVASTVGNEVRINTDYLEVFEGDVYDEFMGILFHETTHLWQWDGKGKAPRGLINGIADFVRLISGWPSQSWTQQRGSGSRWDEGYAVTAYFLEYCDHLRLGFVSELNAKMKYYYSNDFFRQLLGKSVHELWKDYKAAYNGKNRVLARNVHQTYPQPEDDMLDDKVPEVSDSSEGYWQIDVKGVFTVTQISSQNEKVDWGNEHQTNNDPTAEKVKFAAWPGKEHLEIVSTSEDQGKQSFPIHSSNKCTGFRYCVGTELNNMMEKIVSSAPDSCNGPRKIGTGC